MKKLEHKNINGDKLKEIELPKEFQTREVREDLITSAIILARANERQGTKKTKTRAFVSGGGRKPWRQKGTGRARAGSNRSPIWVGGGTVFGPTGKENYSKKMNRKVARKALESAFLSKLDSMIVIDELEFKTPKTKEFKKVLENLELTDKKVLVLVSELSENMILASRNLNNVLLQESGEINVYDLVNADKVLITKESLDEIMEVLK